MLLSCGFLKRQDTAGCCPPCPSPQPNLPLLLSGALALHSWFHRAGGRAGSCPCSCSWLGHRSRAPGTSQDLCSRAPHGVGRGVCSFPTLFLVPPGSLDLALLDTHGFGGSRDYIPSFMPPKIPRHDQATSHGRPSSPQPVAPPVRMGHAVLLVERERARASWQAVRWVAVGPRGLLQPRLTAPPKSAKCALSAKS